jgi:proteasome lid subunit RPN8/RPN11
MEQALSVVLSRLLENDLLSACRRRLPYETCGIIYGTLSDGRLSADGYDLIRNTSSSAVDTFSFHPEDWVSAYFQAQKNQRNIVGFFHTHPQGTAHPSIKDEQGWIPWGTYWIISLTDSNSEIAVYRRGSQEKWVSLPIMREL